MLVAESRMVMGKAHVFHVGSLSAKYKFTANSFETTKLCQREPSPVTHRWHAKTQSSYYISTVFFNIGIETCFNAL